MTKIKEIPSKEILEKYLYINNLHELIWKYRPIELCKTIGNFKLFNRKFAGKKAGCDMRNGYLAVSINGERYKSHRIIYQLTHGNVNEFTHIDHADGNTFNNNPSNLRQSNASDNAINFKGARIDNAGKYRGVSWKKLNKKWQACAYKNGKSIYLGLFSDENEAKNVAYAKRLELFGENWTSQNGY